MDLFSEDEVKRAVEELPENFRMAVLLADVEGFSYKEIAEILAISIGTVMSRLHRGRKGLEKALYEFAVKRRLAEPVSNPATSNNGHRSRPPQAAVPRRSARDLLIGRASG